MQKAKFSNKYRKEIIVSILGILLIMILFTVFFSISINTKIGNSFYKEENYNKALDYYERAYSLFYSFIKENNLGNIAYKQDKYDEAISKYQKSLEHCNSNCETVLYNLGNSYYKEGQKNNDNQTINFYQKAIDSYERSLEIKEDQQTRDNLEYVKNLLQEEQNSESTKEETEDSSTDEKLEENQETKDQGSSSGQSNNGPEEQEGSAGKSSLDERTQGELKRYMERLEQIEQEAEKYHQRNPNQQNQNTNMNSFFEDFFGRENPFTNDPFFNPNLVQDLNGNSTERDW